MGSGAVGVQRAGTEGMAADNLTGVRDDLTEARHGQKAGQAGVRVVFKGVLKQKRLFAMLSGFCCVRSVYFTGQFRQVGGCLPVVAGTRGQRAIAVSVVVAGPGRRQGWGVGGCPVAWCFEVVGG